MTAFTRGGRGQQDYSKWPSWTVVCAALIGINPVWSESPRQPDDLLGLEEVVVTTTRARHSKLQQSLSVSTLDASEFALMATHNGAELLRAVPGLRAESSGGEGNANITVRGLPISAGGARYVQLQEDGLPVLQFGDIAFATADQFVRVDDTLARIEVVRGGAAATLASNAPGGIVNLISQTGETAGGGIALTQGLDFDRTRYDFHYGQGIGETDTHYFIGGFYRQGDSPRDLGVALEQGGQLRGNLSHHFDRGYLRTYFKYLDDRVPMAMPVPVQVIAADIYRFPSIDPRSAGFYSPYWVANPSFDGNNQGHLNSVNDGLQVQSQALGLETEFALSRHWTLQEKLRIADNSGRFTAVFPADNTASGGPFALATGPGIGLPYGGAAFTATVFDVALEDLGNTINDFTLLHSHTLASTWQLDTALGLYSAVQRVDLSWHFNQYLMTLDGNRPQLLSSAATSAVTPGLIAYGTDVWGGCCNRDIDARYQTNSPYLNLNLHNPEWTLELGLREERQRATGNYNAAQNQQYSGNTIQRIDYRVDETAYTLGINYLIAADLSVFIRHSEGYSFNADRIMFADFALDGSYSIPVNQVRQLETGMKWRRHAFSSQLTVFDARTDETNFEATTNTFTDRVYDARGAELELAYRVGNFLLRAGATYTDAEIRRGENSAFNGNTPRRQAKWIYQLQPSYGWRVVDIGLSITGSSRAWGDDANTIQMDAYTLVNAYIAARLGSQLTLALTANNLTDALAYTEVESDGHAARAMDGRAVSGSLRLEF